MKFTYSFFSVGQLYFVDFFSVVPFRINEKLIKNFYPENLQSRRINETLTTRHAETVTHKHESRGWVSERKGGGEREKSGSATLSHANSGTPGAKAACKSGPGERASDRGLRQRPLCHGQRRGERVFGKKIARPLPVSYVWHLRVQSFACNVPSPGFTFGQAKITSIDELVKFNFLQSVTWLCNFIHLFMKLQSQVEFQVDSWTWIYKVRKWSYILSHSLWIK